jgi:agmatine deiminase
MSRRTGRRFPAEWEPHAATCFTWPANSDTWQDVLEPVRRALARVIIAIAQGEAVFVSVADDGEAAQVHLFTDGVPNVTPLLIPSNDCWCRDHGPTIVQDAGVSQAVSWNFNSWGAKYPPFDQDAKIAKQLARFLDVPFESADITLEGGALESNGDQILLTSASCALNSNRNPGLSKAFIEAELIRRTGMPHVGWIEGDLNGDDTDGHIDNIARFVARDSVLMTEKLATDQNLAEFKRLSDETGHPINVHFLPDAAEIEHEYNPLPSTHINFYIANACVVVPTYGGKSDDRACEIIGSFFPEREVMPMDCRHVIRGLGAIHCLSQQIPAPQI